MKKIRNLFYIILTLSLGLTTHSFAMENITPQKLISMIVSFHNNAFGVDYLFNQPIANDKFLKWLEVCEIVKNYALSNSKNHLGIKDATLVSAVNIIDQANRTLVNGIKITYGVRNSTKNLIQMAALFQAIENQMSMIVTQLQNIHFFIDNKKNSQRILIALAMFIETTAKKANKDTRMGHRTDILIPKSSAPNIPVRQTIPLRPPADLPPMYQEEPPFSPPTRPAPAIPTRFIPGPPTDMPPTMPTF